MLPVRKRSVIRRSCVAVAAYALTTAALADLPSTVEKLKPSVVLVGTFDPLASPRFTFRGTGFVVGSGNQVLTNAHVLPAAGSSGGTAQIAIQVWTPKSLWSLRTATVTGRDSARDLALLGFEGGRIAPLAFTANAPKEGEEVAFMGFPIGGALGFSHVTHRGIISSIAALALPTPTSAQLSEKAILQLRQGNFLIYQLDATAYPGNSGGPVFDLNTGAVLGVINSVFVKGTRESALSHPSGISYVIPIENSLNLLESAGR
jgi:serine protease Do